MKQYKIFVETNDLEPIGFVTVILDDFTKMMITLNSESYLDKYTNHFLYIRYDIDEIKDILLSEIKYENQAKRLCDYDVNIAY